jgi:hypothetical protein
MVNTKSFFQKCGFESCRCQNSHFLCFKFSHFLLIFYFFLKISLFDSNNSMRFHHKFLNKFQFLPHNQRLSSKRNFFLLMEKNSKLFLCNFLFNIFISISFEATLNFIFKKTFPAFQFYFNNLFFLPSTDVRDNMANKFN